MTELFYLILFLLVLFLVAFVGYYGWRLMQLREGRDESSRRRQMMTHELHAGPTDGLHHAGAPLSSPSIVGPSVSESPPAHLPARVCDRQVAVRALSDNPVFLRRDGRSGEVTVQIETRPPMPLKYVLDPRARQILQEVATVTSLEFGEKWSVLASEDEGGRLVLTRLT